MYERNIFANRFRCIDVRLFQQDPNIAAHIWGKLKSCFDKMSAHGKKRKKRAVFRKAIIGSRKFGSQSSCIFESIPEGVQHNHRSALEPTFSRKPIGLSKQEAAIISSEKQLYVSVILEGPLLEFFCQQQVSICAAAGYQVTKK